MKSKTHILTFHRALNYGAILQCYALFSAISKYTECDVIDYRANCIENRYKIIGGNRSPKGVLKSALSAPSTYKKREKFDEFIRRRIVTTKKLVELEDLRKYPWGENDKFCVGSDQVWNLELTLNDTSYFFDFLPQDADKFSYAASIGENIREEWKMLFRNRLETFKSVSVREDTAKEQIDSLGIQSHINIDPVFLLSQNEWGQISTPIKYEKEPYVLIYLLQKADSFMDAAIRYAHDRKKRIVIISTGLKRSYDAEYVSDCGPDEFLRYFLKADIVFTNSFHGISFSILLNKQFYYQLQGNNVRTNSRLYDLVKLFHLENRDADHIGDGCIIDYSVVNKIIEREKSRAQEYLKTQILWDGSENAKVAK